MYVRYDEGVTTNLDLPGCQQRSLGEGNVPMSTQPSSPWQYRSVSGEETALMLVNARRVMSETSDALTLAHLRIAQSRLHHARMDRARTQLEGAIAAAHAYLKPVVAADASGSCQQVGD